MKHSLMLYSRNGTCEKHTLEKPLTKIGRAADNDVVLTDAGKSVSRYHAVISSNGGITIFIEDQNSSMDFLNGQLLNGRVRLTPNDVVKMAISSFGWQKSQQKTQKTMEANASK